VRNDFFTPLNAIKRDDFFFYSKRPLRQFAMRAVKNRAAVGD
jgi:hypothetical protein